GAENVVRLFRDVHVALVLRVGQVTGAAVVELGGEERAEVVGQRSLVDGASLEGTADPEKAKRDGAPEEGRDDEMPEVVQHGSTSQGMQWSAGRRAGQG